MYMTFYSITIAKYKRWMILKETTAKLTTVERYVATWKMYLNYVDSYLVNVIL